MTIKLNEYEIVVKNWYHLMQSGYIYISRNTTTGVIEESDLFPDLHTLFRHLVDNL